MALSSDRILATHVGSLARPHDLLEGAGSQRELDKVYELAAQAKLAAAKPATP